MYKVNLQQLSIQASTVSNRSYRCQKFITDNIIRISKLQVNKIHCSQIMENLFPRYQKLKIQIVLWKTKTYIYIQDLIALQVNQFLTNSLWESLKTPKVVFSLKDDLTPTEKKLSENLERETEGRPPNVGLVGGAVPATNCLNVREREASFV